MWTYKCNLIWWWCDVDGKGEHEGVKEEEKRKLKWSKEALECMVYSWSDASANQSICMWLLHFLYFFQVLC